MASGKIVCEDHYIDAFDKGIRLHVREKRPRGKRRFTPQETLLLVHGRGPAAPVVFDLPVPGYSWMDRLASRGYDVFAVSVRGFGYSTYPPEMIEDPVGKAPAIRGHTAARDIGAAVRFIRNLREVENVNILGRSWDSTTVPTFASAHNPQVRKVVLYAPYYAGVNAARAAQFEDPERPGHFNEKLGAWFWTTEADLHRRWWGHIPGTGHHNWCERSVARAVWETRLRYSPEGASRRPSAVKSPNGSYTDLFDRARGIPAYDAAKLRCPALLIFGDYDGTANEAEAWDLFGKMTNSRGKRFVVIGDGTQYMEFEKRREELYREVENFLES